MGSLKPSWSTAVSAAGVLLLTLTIAGSTAQAQWVPGSDVIIREAVVAAILCGLLALARFVPWPVGLVASLAAAPVAAYIAAGPALSAAHPHDPADPIGLIGVWWGRMADGSASSDISFFLYLLALLFWLVGGWLAWCVLRWRQPLLGLIPGAAAFTTTLLNFPSDQNGYMLAFLILTLGLLLWTQFTKSVADVRRRHIRLSGDASWDFWETGVLVMAGVIALGIFLPPLSHVDSTVDIESGVFRNWAELQQRLNHQVAFGRGVAGGTSIGFNPDVKLAGPIQKTGGVVMTYTIDGTYGGPRGYFAGLDLMRTANGEWYYPAADPSGTAIVTVNKDEVMPYSEQYLSEAVGSFKIQMLKPPAKAPDVIFHPGELYKADRTTTLREVPGINGALTPGSDRLFEIDRVSGVGKGAVSGQYHVTITYSLATEDQLRGAGTAYPVWLDPYRNFANLYRPRGATTAPDPLFPGPVSGATIYRSPEVLQRIHDLAVQITAGKDNPYDQVQAIETYLRTNYTYTLTPAEPPRGVDPLDYFLFNSKEGYCEYFATAMGDLVRSLGIPVRLVQGYGQGTYDDRVQRFVIKESDAHTWVETYFPQYGWIPWEPTPDGTYFPIERGNNTSAACARDAEICDPSQDPNAGATSPTGKPDKGAVDPGTDAGLSGGGGLRVPSPAVVLPWAAALLLLLALMYFAVSRYLRPTTAAGAWSRTAFLARLGGMGRRPGETPFEFGRRLGEEAPETRSTARVLAEAYAEAAYAPPELARSSRDRVLDAFRELRPMLVARIRNRNRFV
ncbi:MAG TPA: transglutaminase-like domain-containing protein [Candidatus Dormibacteraeota bacterium]